MYHAHFYYNISQRENVIEIRNKFLEASLPHTYIGNLIDRLVGPHTLPMFEIDFESKYLKQYIEWLENNRQKHSVLIHPVDDNEYLAHTDNAIWVGERLPLNLDKL